MSNRIFFFNVRMCLGPCLFCYGSHLFWGRPISPPTWTTWFQRPAFQHTDVWPFWGQLKHTCEHFCSQSGFLHMSPLLTTFMALEIEKAQIKAPGYRFFQLSVLTCLCLLPRFPWGEIDSSGCHLGVPVPLSVLCHVCPAMSLFTRQLSGERFPVAN